MLKDAPVVSTYQDEYQHATALIKNARDMTQLLMDDGLIEMSN